LKHRFGQIRAPRHQRQFVLRGEVRVDNRRRLGEVVGLLRRGELRKHARGQEQRKI
jgi:hypothetical protein